jgi:hypothetical protein
MTTISAEVAEDRERIRAIISLPEASNQLRAAIAIAVAGASVDEARIVLQLSASALTPDQVAAGINQRSR